MKTTKNLLLVIASMFIASMIILFSCRNYTGPAKDGIFGYDKDYTLAPLSGSGGGLVVHGFTLPPNSLSQEEQNDYYDPEYNSITLFNNNDIPALITTSNGTILATAGTTNAQLIVKRSTDMGKTWLQSTVSGTVSSASYSRPFFINCHNGDVLLGITSNVNNTGKSTYIYRSSDNGNTWTKQTNINFTNICTDTKDCFVTYGQGVTLRHQSDSDNKLMFPYFYTSTKQPTNGKKGDTFYTATMLSSDDGDNFSNNFNDKTGGYGSFSTYETKFYECSNGNILLIMNTTNNNNNLFCMLSTDCGKNWSVKTSINNKENLNNAKHLDLTPYEFRGKPIKNGGSAYGLMAYFYTGNNYGIKLTTNDFNMGSPNLSLKFQKERDDFISGCDEDNGYPAITVLPDGTIATLTEEGNGKIVFRRFNYYWFTDGQDSIDYSKDLKFNN